MTCGNATLSIENASKVYGSGDRAVVAVNKVSLEAHAGEVIVVMGPSGSGKTTLLTMAGALLRPTEGTVHLCGIDITRLSEGKLAAIRREKVGFVYQSFNLMEALTAEENVRLLIREQSLNGRDAATRTRDLLETFGLSHRAKALPKQMSDGEKQRVAIARALAKDPALILADEPTANLDARRGHEVMELLRRQATELDKAVVIVSHDRRIREFAHRILWLEDGRIHPEPPD
jgi:putative ABC transport system ATP-binding protein